MTDERRYREEESKEIFEAAAAAGDSDRHAPTSAKGLTLAELQEIGLEVGLSPVRIAEAASALEVRRTALPHQTSFGMPISVGRTVALPRAPTDREWELLVAELRETFNAQGKVGTSGSARQWTNGKLHAYVEPTEAGYRLRLGTLKGNAPWTNMLGVAGMGVALVMLVVLLLTGNLTGNLADALVLPVIFGAGGVTTVVSNLLRLPRWARQRQDQMEYIATRAQALIGSEPDRD
ncbi:MAG: hypothetical protein BMS9Abin29_1048 [Gemmatimonadota bacterium]|nr:MAG: hypothetical protein BMS9Abin29_1048 [Gemmatimonadota bacterium]